MLAMGYTKVWHYAGGLADWQASGGRIEAGAPLRGAPAHPPWWVAGMDLLGGCSINRLLTLWLGMIVACGLAYWGLGHWQGQGLRDGSGMGGLEHSGLLSTLYFSFVTALSIGYGDVVPLGMARVLAVVEGAAALLLFGCVVSKLVSRRQEELTEEIHRITYEDRLGRVRTNLHLVLAELQTLAVQRASLEAQPARITVRVESIAAVFAGELQTVHDLLYRPQQLPGEQVLESILASLAAVFREFAELLESPGFERSRALNGVLQAMGGLAEEICGECVPRQYADHLKGWMNQVQELARQLS